MNPRNLRNVFMAGAALRHILTASDGEDEGGAGGAPPADPPAAADPPEGDSPPEAGAGAEGGDGGNDDPPAPPKPQRTPWQAKRIDALTAQARAAQEEADRLRAENQQAAQQLAAYKALYGDNAAPAAPGPAAAPPAPAGAERTYTQTELHAEAQRIAALNTLNQKCETLFDQGAKTHSASWNDRVNQAGQAFGKDLLNRVDFFEALTKLPNAVDVYHELAGDLDHMSDVLAMGPLDLGMELSRMSATLNTKPKAPPVSRAPAPIEPIDGGGSNASDDLAKMSMNDFAKTREKQREERMKARGY